MGNSGTTAGSHWILSLRSNVSGLRVSSSSSRHPGDLDWGLFTRRFFPQLISPWEINELKWGIWREDRNEIPRVSSPTSRRGVFSPSTIYPFGREKKKKEERNVKWNPEKSPLNSTNQRSLFLFFVSQNDSTWVFVLPGLYRLTHTYITERGWIGLDEMTPMQYASTYKMAGSRGGRT